MLPLTSLEQRSDSISELLSSVEAFDGVVAARFLLPKLEAKLARLRADMRKFRSEMRAVKWHVVMLLDDIGVQTPGPVASSALLATCSDAAALEEVVCQADYDTGHAGIEVIEHLPSIRHLVAVFRSLEELHTAADSLQSKAKRLRDECFRAL